MKTIIIALIICMTAVTGYARTMSVEQFDREQAAYQQELYKTAREAGYDPTSKKSIAEQYEAKRLTEQTIKTSSTITTGIRARIQPIYPVRKKQINTAVCTDNNRCFTHFCGKSLQKA